jgi:glyoxylase-like metal-dependent hydrolase (beta-lactamase superfamily II)
VCRNCGVESFAAARDPAWPCPICTDERQFPEPAGQAWLSQEDLRGYRIDVRRLGGGAYALSVAPKAGIGQTAYLVWSGDGWVLWDPLPKVDDAALAARIASADGCGAGLGGITVEASHPHMFGAQSSWAAACSGTVYVNEADSQWVDAQSFPYRFWSGTVRVGDRVELVQLGGHFPGSSYLVWRSFDGAEWLFVSDTTQIRPNGRFCFQWSYPNALPLGEGEVRSMLARLPAFAPTRAFDNFGHTISGDVREVIVQSALRHLERIRA